MHRYRRFHLRLLTVFPLRGTLERSNLFESHRSNQWLTLVKAGSADLFFRSAVFQTVWERPNLFESHGLNQWLTWR